MGIKDLRDLKKIVRLPEREAGGGDFEVKEVARIRRTKMKTGLFIICLLI